MQVGVATLFLRKKILVLQWSAFLFNLSLLHMRGQRIWEHILRRLGDCGVVLSSSGVWEGQPASCGETRVRSTTTLRSSIPAGLLGMLTLEPGS